MSSASYASASGARRVISDTDAYSFALHAAYVEYALDTYRKRELAAAATSSSATATGGVTAPQGARRSSESGRRTIGMLADRMRDVGAPRMRFPEKLLRRLSDCMQRIAMGRDDVYTQPGLRQTCGVFFGTLNDAATVRRLRDNRRIEEVIMLFVSTANATINKRGVGDAERRVELDMQIAALLDLLQECLRGLGASRELIEALDEFSVTAVEEPPAAATATDFPLIKIVAGAFSVDSSQLARDVGALDPLSALKIATADLKRLVSRISAGTPGQDEFGSPHALAKWRMAEQSTISQLIMDMCRLEPQLPRLATDDGAPVRIPPCPPACYRLVLEQCVDKDLDTIRSKSADEHVPLGVLSAAHTALLDVCAARWRVSRGAAVAAHMHVMRSRYDRGEVPLECVGNALASVTRLVRSDPPSEWLRSDVALLSSTLSALTDSLLRTLYPMCERIMNTDPATVVPLFAMVHSVKRSGLVDQTTLEPGLAVLAGAMRTNATQAYTARATVAAGAPSAIDTLTVLLDWVEAQYKRFSSTYPAALPLAPAEIIGNEHAKLLVHDCASMRVAIHAGCIGTDDARAIGDALELIGRVRALSARAPGVLDSEALFAPIVRHWLELAERRGEMWVANAIGADTFVPDEGTVYSSSVRDLHDALQQPARVLDALKWPDGAERASFYTRFARMAAHLIEAYSRGLESMFMDEMLSQDAAATAVNEVPAWVERARATLGGDKRPPPGPQVIQPTSCVKLNDIEGARALLDALYRDIDADAVAAAAAPADSVEGVPQFMFAVKLVQAELVNVHVADTFVTLSDVRGHRLAKTRTIFDTAMPRWDEVFDLGTDEPMWLSATVWARDGAAPVLLGRAPLHLDPALFSDVAAHETWLELSNGGGRLHVRLSMESAHDDILFYFGRGFRVLKRVESDMVRVLIDRMSVCMHQILSRATLRTLVKGRLNIDRAIGNVRALYASAIERANGTASMIPPVEMRRREALTDVEIEAAIVPLLDYLEDALGTLKASLSEDEALLVLTRVWKEVLYTIEALLVPPLAATPSDMAQLSDKEVDIVFKWLSFLRSYFNAYDPETGVAHGIPLDVLQGPKYRELLSYLLLHDQSTDDLMIECVRGFQARLASAPDRRSKSVIQQRSLGTIRAHKRAKADDSEPALTHMAMKILRMRPGTADFLAQQLISMDSLQQALSAGPGLRRMSRRLH